MAVRTILTLLLASAALATAGGCDGGNGMRASENLETVTIKGHTFHLERALDEETRRLGLMYRESIPEDGGMLFVFPEPSPQSFWMKDCFVDIDIIYLDARGRVTATHRMKARPPRRSDESESAYERRLRADDYGSRYAAQFAIELRAGWLDLLDIGVDERIEIDPSRLKAMAR